MYPAPRPETWTALHPILEGQQPTVVRTWPTRSREIAPLLAAEVLLVVRLRVADGQPHHEAVHLGVGQELGARGPRRVSRVAMTTKGLGTGWLTPSTVTSSLLHGLQQGAGCVRWPGSSSSARKRLHSAAPLWYSICPVALL